MTRFSLLGLASLLLSLPVARADAASQLLDASGVKGGLVVHLGCGDATTTMALRANDRFTVHGLAADAKEVAAARQAVLKAGAYGPVSIDLFDGKQLPYVGNSVNLIVAEGKTGQKLDLPEAKRVLAPLGTLMINAKSMPQVPHGLVVDSKSAVPGWTILRKPYPSEMGEWNHFLQGPDNNAVGQDTIAEQPRSIQWVAGPRWARSHEEMASTSIGVTDNGRVFFIVDEAPLASIRFTGQWRLIARDAFNGKLLWKADIPNWIDHLRHFRAGPVHLQRRLAAVDGAVYATLGLAEPVTALDAATGKVLHVYRDTEHTEEILVKDGILYLVIGTSEVKRTGEGLHDRGEPEATPFRFIAAVDAKSGKTLWRKKFDPSHYLLPLTLAVRGNNVFCQTINGMLRLDAKSGDEVWKTPRSTPANRMAFSAPTVVATDEVLLAADHETKEPAKGPVTFGVHGWNLSGFNRKAKCVMNAYAVKDGKLLWSAPCAEDYNAPVDVFVLGDVVFLGKSFIGYNIKTGEEVRKLDWSGPAVAMAHPRCHRYKATVKNLFTGRSGIEVASFESGWLGNNSWIRGTCQWGIMPANGLLYKAPDACGCYPKTKTKGFFAAGPRRDAHRHQAGKVSADRLEKGPAYSRISDLKSQIPDSSWPSYRHDANRSGASSAPVSKNPQLKWNADLGGTLTQAVSDGERVYLASADTHTVHALSANDGKPAWSFTAGGGIDSAPTLYGGMLIFGSKDGWLYALRASDGELAWRFQAAPIDRRVLAYDELESVWPLHGSVLVRDGAVYTAAGRSSYIDDGIALYKLDPKTGKVLASHVERTIDPETNQPTVTEPGRGFDMPGTTVDLLSSDGELVYMKHLAFTPNLEPTDSRPHLYSPGGMIGEEWFVRNYWMYGQEMSAGWGGWARAAGSSAFGRILSFTKDKIYGYGREMIQSGATGHKADNYQLYASTKLAPAPAPEPAPKPDPKAKGKKKRTPKPKVAKPEKFWAENIPLMVRAMVLTPDSLVIAGPPDLGKKSSKILAFENEDEALAAFKGEKMASLAVVSTKDGKMLFEAKLDAMPVFDGLSAGGGNIYVSLKNGTLQCWK